METAGDRVRQTRQGDWSEEQLLELQEDELELQEDELELQEDELELVKAEVEHPGEQL